MVIQTEADFFVVKLDAEEVMVDGYILPPTARKKSEKGVVVGEPIGNESNIQIGDRAFIPENAGTPIEYKGEQYIIAKANRDIVAYIKSK